METSKIEYNVQRICQNNGWVTDRPFEDMSMILEEAGEVAREIRRIEMGRQRPDEVEPDRSQMVRYLAEEVGDLLFPLVKIANYYGFTLETAFKLHLAKMGERYIFDKPNQGTPGDFPCKEVPISALEPLPPWKTISDVHPDLVNIVRDGGKSGIFVTPKSDSLPNITLADEGDEE